MSFLGIMGFVLMIAMVALLLKGKTIPAVVFILLPIIVGFIVGFTPNEIAGYIQEGVSGVATTAILFIFAVMFFGIMSDAGVFDRIVGKVVGYVGDNLVLLMFATVLGVQPNDIWRYCIPAQVAGNDRCYLYGSGSGGRGAEGPHCIRTEMGDSSGELAAFVCGGYRNHTVLKIGRKDGMSYENNRAFCI